MKLILAPDSSAVVAESLLHSMKSGHVNYTDDLCVLDAILKAAPPELEVWSGDKKWDRALLERIRFERGLDPRPKPDRSRLGSEVRFRISQQAQRAAEENCRAYDNPYHEFSDEADQWYHSFREHMLGD